MKYIAFDISQSLFWSCSLHSFSHYLSLIVKKAYCWKGWILFDAVSFLIVSYHTYSYSNNRLNDVLQDNWIIEPQSALSECMTVFGDNEIGEKQDLLWHIYRGHYFSVYGDTYVKGFDWLLLLIEKVFSVIPFVIPINAFPKRLYLTR